MMERPHCVCLTFDFDALSVWLSDNPLATPAELSRGEYGARIAVPRILRLLAAHDLPATFFVPGHTAESFPDVVEAILDAGHEIAHHGYGHEDPSTQNPAQERRSLERGLAVLERFLGSPPLGYRSPSWDYSTVTLSLLVEYGFLYDSSLFAGDLQPYHPRLGDEVGVEEPLKMGQEVDLWEFPVDFCLDDWPHFVFSFDPPRAGLSAPSKVFEVWVGEYDYMGSPPLTIEHHCERLAYPGKGPREGPVPIAGHDNVVLDSLFEAVYSASPDPNHEACKSFLERNVGTGLVLGLIAATR